MLCLKRPVLWGRAFAALVGVAVAVVASGGAALAKPDDDLTQVQRQIARTEAALENASAEVIVARRAYAAVTAELPAVRQRLDEARTAFAVAWARRVSAIRAVELAQQDLAAAGKAAGQRPAALEPARDDIARSPGQAGPGRDLDGMQLVLAVQNPAMFVDGLVYLRYLRIEQQRGLEISAQARAAAVVARTAWEGFQRTADLVLADADTALAAAAMAEAVAAGAEADLRDTIAARQTAIAVAEQHRAATQARLTELSAARERVRARTQAPAGDSAQLPGGAKLLMPVATTRKSSDFGMRFDPYYQRWQLHAGVDLAADAGQPIWAAAAGTVIRAGWNGGYGNYTCLDHGTDQGKGFTTCYAHQSRIDVSVGERVERGDVIGLVGSTGAATGDHLHFEVRLNGTPVNPLPWLPACLC